MDFVTTPLAAKQLIILASVLPILAVIFVLRSAERKAVKALWVFLIISLPFLGPVLYLLFRIFNKPKLQSQQ